MAKTVQKLFEHYLPGGGFTTGGTPKQGKTQVWGRVTINPYTVGGEPLTPNDVGLTTIDNIVLTVDSVGGTAIGAVEASAVYRYTAQTVVVFEAAADQAEAEAVVLRFVAQGDSASDSASDVETFA
jgi:hypothetical protein